MISGVPLKDFNTLNQDQASAILASASNLTDFSAGSFLEAIIEANSSNSLWLQALITALLAITRLQTCFGNDVDTFIQQFGYFRPRAVASTGVVTFTRTVTTGISYIPASTTIVATQINNIQFTTIVDTANPAYDSATNSYILGVGISSIVNIPIQCIQSGIVGNVGANSINTIVSSLVNVTSVNNPNTLVNGADVATDDQTKADFVLYLQGLSRATYLAIVFSVLNTPTYGPQVKRYQINENINESGAQQLGFFFVVVDDGSGSPSSDMLNAISANVGLYRGLSIQWDVIAPTIVTMTIVMQLKLDDNSFQTEVTANVTNALLNYINNLPVGGTKIVTIPPSTSGKLYYSILYDIIFNADPHIINIVSLTLNASNVPVNLNYKEIAQSSAGLITITYP